MAERETSNILWRGVMGGLLGTLVKSAIFSFYYGYINPQESGYIKGSDMVGFFAVIGLPAAAFFSILITVVIRSIKFKSGWGIGILGGAAIGIGIMGLILGLLLLADVRGSFSWVLAGAFYGDYGVTIGAVAGMIGGYRKRIRFR